MRNRLKTTLIDQMVSIVRNYPDIDNIEKQAVVNVTSIKEFSDFLNKAQDLIETGTVVALVYSSSLGITDAVVGDGDT